MIPLPPQTNMNKHRFSFGIAIAGTLAMLLMVSPGFAALVTQSSDTVKEAADSQFAGAPSLGSLLGTAGALVCLGILTVAGLLRSRARTA